MQTWQIVLGLFFVLLPLVLMVDFWGDERLSSRGRPIARPWPQRARAEDVDDSASHQHGLDRARAPSPPLRPADP